MVKLTPRAGAPCVCDIEVLHEKTPALANAEVGATEDVAKAALGEGGGRPAQVATEDYRENWDRIFGRREARPLAQLISGSEQHPAYVVGARGEGLWRRHRQAIEAAGVGCALCGRNRLLTGLAHRDPARVAGPANAAPQSGAQIASVVRAARRKFGNLGNVEGLALAGHAPCGDPGIGWRNWASDRRANDRG